jgi:hypothetical protein
MIECRDPAHCRLCALESLFSPVVIGVLDRLSMMRSVRLDDEASLGVDQISDAKEVAAEVKHRRIQQQPAQARIKLGQ